MSLRRHTMTSILKRDNQWLSRPPGLLYVLYRHRSGLVSSRFYRIFVIQGVQLFADLEPPGGLCELSR